MNPIYTPAPVVRRNALLLIVSIALTFSILRILLHQSPDPDFDIGRYNVHHLFTGLLLITAGGVPLAVFRGSTRRLDVALVVFGAGLGMALDEWVYLIATDALEYTGPMTPDFSEETAAFSGRSSGSTKRWSPDCSRSAWQCRMTEEHPHG